MGASYESLMQLEFPEVHDSYSERDTIFYALSLGIGNEPTSPEQLRMVYERDLCALPTMAVTMAHPGFWVRDMDTGLDFTRIVHGAQSLKVHQVLPTSGEVIGRSRIRDVIDKGEGKGALIYFERVICDAQTDAPLCSMEQTIFCRGDGGMGGSGNTPAPAHPIPDRAPDLEITHELLPQSALLYRLNGDMNPLHADPEIAKKAGFDRPILQGLATYGTAGLAIISGLCKGDPSGMRGLEARFTAPVYPGETLLTKIWRHDDGVASARVTVPGRDVIAIDNCKAMLA
jgi:acyl dehydratase